MEKFAKLVKCPKCRRLLSKRVPIHLGSDETFIVHIKHRGMEIYTFDATITCPSCGARLRVNGADGIVT